MYWWGMRCHVLYAPTSSQCQGNGSILSMLCVKFCQIFKVFFFCLPCHYQYGHHTGWWYSTELKQGCTQTILCTMKILKCLSTWSILELVRLVLLHILNMSQWKDKYSLKIVLGTFPLTHGTLDKMPCHSQWHFSSSLSLMRFSCFDWNFISVFCRGYNWWWFSIGSGNDATLMRKHTITSNNDDMVCRWEGQFFCNSHWLPF